MASKGGMNLDKLIASMQPKLMPHIYVFAKTTNKGLAQQADALMTFHEAEATTLILQQTEADTLGIDYEFPCRQITLNVHSSLEAVGFIAKIAVHLSKYNMGVNPVAGFYHDHLFIDATRVDDAMEALKELSSQ
ncbi:MAG: ACT domain-containing protein [Hyphomicrobiales bacterium]